MFFQLYYYVTVPFSVVSKGSVISLKTGTTELCDLLNS